MKSETVSSARGGWITQASPRLIETLAARFGTPLYVYSAPSIREHCRTLRRAFPRAEIRYAMKANSCRAVLDIIRTEGLGIDAVSPWEVRLAREVGFKKRQIVYSGSNPSTRELERIRRAGVTINIDSLSVLQRYGEIARGGEVSLRFNLDIGDGHHPHVITAGPASKFGLAVSELSIASAIAAKAGLTVVGVHQHIGSGLFDRKVFVDAIEKLLKVATRFGDLKFVDIGGGFGVPHRPDEQPIDLDAWGEAVEQSWAAFERAVGRTLTLVIEPGRYAVAEAGALLTRVTTIKRAKDRVFVGVDTGMHHLVRPAMYGSYHPIHAIQPRAGKAERCFVVGPICEAGDVLAEDRRMVVPAEGDLLAVGVAGAYGYAMASQYNLRGRPAEVVVDEGTVILARKRERYRDVVG